MHLKCHLSIVLDWYLIDLSIIHAKSVRAIILSNQNDRASPAALAWLYDALTQHLLEIGLFHM